MMLITQPVSNITLIYIHGVGLCHHAWDNVRQHMPSTYVDTAINLPGHGDSHYPLCTTMDELVGTVKHDITSPSIIIGHSLGALLALELMMLGNMKPCNIKAAIILNPVYNRNDAQKKAVRQRYYDLRDGHNNPEPTLDRWYGDSYPIQRSITRTWLEQHGQGYAAAYKIFAFHDDSQHIKNITLPSLVITGEDDYNSTPEMAQQLANIMPNGQHNIIKKAGHMAIMTHPEMVATEIKQFLTNFF